MEYSFEGLRSLSLDWSLKNSMVLFITSEVFFFISFFWSYFHFTFSETMELGWMWSPISLIIFDYRRVPLLNTLILLSSGLTITISHYYYINENFRLSLFYLFFTLVFGVIFTFLQFVEYKRSFFSVYDSRFGRVYFILTGFHGIHVIIGRIFIFVTIIRSSNMILSLDRMNRFDLCSWYWHFVDVVWIFLFYFLYYLTFLRFSIIFVLLISI